MDKDFNDLQLSSATKLSYQISLNIVKLQCKEKGIISIYMEKDDFYHALDDIGVCALYWDVEYDELFSDYQLPAKGYYQAFYLVGTTSINLSEIGGKKYTSDFFTELSLSSSLKTGEYSIEFYIKDTVTMTLINFNVGESTDKVAVENEKILLTKNNRVIIPLKANNDSKYIKITSSVDGFYWDYQYSQTPDVNYLPKLSYDSKHFQKGKTVYIDNPYIYQNKKTDFNWFISFIHNNEEEATFYFEYINENGNNNSSYAWIWIWIILFILFIAIIALVAWLFYRKKKIESNIENFMNNL